MAYRLSCPCGTSVTAPKESILDDVRAHLSSAHGGRNYTDGEIMLMATVVPE